MKKLFLLLILFSSLRAFSQIRELDFDRLSVENGLPDNVVLCSLQDRFGYIWFGTQNGLVRYDGYDVKVYKLGTPDKKEQTICAIASIYEDSKGTLWLGSYMHGLFRFNRSTDNFTHFKHTSNKGNNPAFDLPYKISEDSEGHIWTMNITGEGKNHLDRLDPATGAMTTYDSLSKGQNYIPTNAFKQLLSDSKDRLWLGTGNGLYQYDVRQKKFISFSASDTSGIAETTYIYEAPSQPGLLWLIKNTSQGSRLVQFDPEEKKESIFKSQAPGKDPEKMLTLFEDSSRRMWVGTDRGISRFDRSSGTFTSYTADGSGNNPWDKSCFDIREGRKGDLWILSGKGLLHLASPETALHRYTNNESNPEALPTTNLRNALVDKNGGLWIGTGGYGVYRLNEKRSQFEFIHQTRTANSYPGGRAYDIALLKTGNYLVSTPTGLYESDKTLANFKQVHLSKEKNVSIASVLVDDEGVAWIGSGWEGLFRYDPNTKQVTNFRNVAGNSASLSSDRISKIYQDSRQQLWIGTYNGGLCRLNRAAGKFQRYSFIISNQIDAPQNGELDDNDVVSMYEDRQGVLWVGTSDGGLNRLDQRTGKFTSYQDKANGFICPKSIYEDRQGRLWVGTYAWGLFLFNRQTGDFRRFTEKEGLIYDNVASIREDGAGNLWLAGSRGFSILNPSDFSITTLSTHNGLPSVNMHQAATATAPDGDWLMGTANGILRFNPDMLVSNPTPPQVMLQSLRYMPQGKRETGPSTIFLDARQQVELRHNENRVTFQYTGIHYTNPSLNQYHYKLEGYDEDWIVCGTQRTATYTNLSPGTYTFLVKAASSDGVWSERPASLAVVIHPPWWQTWWAYGLYTSLFVSSLWGFVQFRSRHLKREKLLLEHKVSERTAEVLQQKDEISAQRDKLESTLATLKSTQSQLIQSEKMASLGELTAGIAHEIQNPLNFVNNFSEVNTELAVELKEALSAGNKAEAISIADYIHENEQKINLHGKRADAIVKGMLQHARTSTGEKQLTDVNALADEYLRLAYHAIKAQDKGFSCTLETFNDQIQKIKVVPEELGRVLLNIFNNAFYAVQQKQRLLQARTDEKEEAYKPTVSVSIRQLEGRMEIRVRDNGTGMTESVKRKIFQPFFTTKPAGQGTGLGLSLSYDIITKGHGGEMRVASEEGEWSELIIVLPYGPITEDQFKATNAPLPLTVPLPQP